MSKKKSAKKKTAPKTQVSEGVEKKHLEEFDVTDGKDRSKFEKELQEVKELEELLGMPQMNPYGTLNRELFKRKLEDCSASELTDLAARVGLPRERNMRLLKNSLMQSFDFYAQKHDVTVQGQAKPIIDPSSPEYENAVKLFKDL
jgi:hypothetical protein|tara:strand:+ start:329 stop:763 length:435 start_codon:yes stop_codon:yes gene_type:complete